MRKLLYYNNFRVSVFFFEKSFRVPKIMPKVLFGIAYRNLLFYGFAFNRFVLLLEFI